MKTPQSKALESAKERKRAIKDSRYTTTTEPGFGGKRYGVYHQDTGDMKVMGIGKKGLQRARDYRAKH